MCTTGCRQICHVTACPLMTQPWMQPWIVPQRSPVQFSAPPGHSRSTSMSGCTPEGRSDAGALVELKHGSSRIWGRCHDHSPTEMSGILFQQARLMCAAGRMKRRRYHWRNTPTPTSSNAPCRMLGGHACIPCSEAQRRNGSRM